MPQMAPLWWETLFIFFILSFMMMIIMLFFNKTYSAKMYKSTNTDTTQFKWKW
uniref:ATP synthase F0 subunit 8 n=1 Tax=Homoeocerus striicornis TaxID=2795333 RepID=UPI002A805724|nr:ATP synthase F0 subunit 8 [Homoeocerus striicornis]WOZ13981.1 ATP synthase F0 subunit 8 [Homoeocerus striicornis]